LTVGGFPTANSAMPTSPAEGPPRSVGPAPLFTDPLWLPIRRPAAVSCVRTNCSRSGKANHGYWAIDFLGDRGDPVNAAGYGIAHIGARSSGCATGKLKRGNWVWVDHGAGEVTVYTHLAAIQISDGQRVTPATVLGPMGTTGTCGTDYLHYERRTGGVRGVNRYPLAAVACLRGKPQLYPQAAGFRNWDRLPIRPKRRWVSSNGTACTTAPGPIAAPTGLRIQKRTASMVRLRWDARPAARYAVMSEAFRRRTLQWRSPKYRYTKRTTIAFRGLRPRSTHRFRIAIDGSSSNSAWTVPVVVRLK
jgi:hypothetical protein